MADWSIFHDHFINNFFAKEFAVAKNLPAIFAKFSKQIFAPPLKSHHTATKGLFCYSAAERQDNKRDLR